MRQITHLCLLLSLASCASVPPEQSAVPVALLPYADAARFLPPRHSSLLFLATKTFGDGAWASVLLARCGSDFEMPGGVGQGRYRGVEVLDFGAARPHGGVFPGLASEPQPVPPIGGVPVWYEREERSSGVVLEYWSARVDDRFLVWSHDRELLEHALARTGHFAELLQPFTAVQLLPDAVEGVVCVLPRPRERPDDPTLSRLRLLPVEPTVVCVPDATRLLLFHQHALPAEFIDACSQGFGAAPTTMSRGEFRVTEVAVAFNDFSVDLVLACLFGLQIFI